MWGQLAGAAIGGLLGGMGGGAPDEIETVNVPWKGIQPYMTGDGLSLIHISEPTRPTT